MTPRSALTPRFLCLVLVLVPLTLSCSRAPREHWWQFWRARPSEVIVVSDDDIPGERSYDDPYGTGNLPPDYEVGLPEPDPIRAATTGDLVELATIFFDYDSATLSPEGRTALEENAEWIRHHPGLNIRVEGHCDERGTEEYNYNLGQRRAQSVREFLVLEGAESDNLRTWSWGELRPLDTGGAESAWRRNRRVQFAVWGVE